VAQSFVQETGHQGERADQFRPLCRQNGRYGGAERMAHEVDVRCADRFGYRCHLPGQRRQVEWGAIVRRLARAVLNET
jgi:hypothetical protein